MWIPAYFPDVSWNGYFEYHTDPQSRKLRSENVTFNRAFDSEYEKHIDTQKGDANFKIKNFRTRFFSFQCTWCLLDKFHK